jgi:hypothetical protein
MHLSEPTGMLCDTQKTLEGVVSMEERVEIEIESVTEDARVYAWRVEQLGRLGLSKDIADAAANLVDWHEDARLVKSGCPTIPRFLQIEEVNSGRAN